VTVQIALDGQAAHVDFTAAVAATRESIEQSLPALAAALRESGFTLAGGGVSSHAGQGNGDPRRDRAGAGHGNRSRTDVGADAGPSLSAPRRWVRSLLDVYA
jgi:flagellar hook-length control protein FliK